MGIYTAVQDFDHHPFIYKITRLADSLQVDFSRPLRCSVRPLIATSIVAAAGVAVLHWFGIRFWSVALASFPPAVGGIVLPGCFSWVRRTTMWLSPSGINIRKGVFGHGTVRSFPMAQVTAFEMGAAGHSRLAVLKFEVGRKWIIFTGANDLEENEFLRDLEANGGKIPQ